MSLSKGQAGNLAVYEKKTAHRWLSSFDMVDNEPTNMAVITVRQLKDPMIASMLVK